jgi:hypothetical protein
MPNEVKKLNAITIADIEKINGLIKTAIQAVNGLEFSTVGTAWTATTSISTSRDRRGTGGAGTNTDFVLMGGYDTDYRNYTDEWNGSSWASQSGMPKNYLTGGWYAGGRFGRSSNDAGSVGGYRYNYSMATKEYNGSSWSLTGNVGTGRQGNGATGESTNAAVTFGGYNGSDLNSTEEYNGSSWSSGNVLPFVSNHPGAMGSLNDALLLAGKNGGSNAQTCAEYNGTSWSTIASINQAAGQEPQGFGLVSTTAHANGTSGVAYAGSGADHDVFNGSTWSAATSSITTRTSGGGGGGDASGFIASGVNAIGLTATCEEWT